MDGQMKQRIRVVGIIKRGDDILLLKKIRGRAEELPEWELLTGKIRFGEQPEEAMARAAYEYLGVEVTGVKLADVVTFVGLAEASQLGNLYIIYEVSIPEMVKIVPTERYTAYKFIKQEEVSALNLNEATTSVLEILNKDFIAETGHNKAKDVANGATVYVDGGSKGNPGPAAIGYYIVGEGGKEIKRGGEFIGFATSRMAEYQAMREGCEQAMELGLKRVRFVGDNLMVINQLRGIYKLKNKDLIPIYDHIQEMLKNFEAVAFTHVKRAQNMKADQEANKALEGHFNRKEMRNML